MNLLKSKKGIKIPKVFFIDDKSKIKDIPIGVPFILGDIEMKKAVIQVLEYEVLYQAALRSGYPFNFKQILKDNGFKDLDSFSYIHRPYVDFKDGDTDYESENYSFKKTETSIDKFKRYIKDTSSYVNIDKLKSLNIFPIWLDTIEDAISVNTHNFATYDYNMYNKKLGGMYGGTVMSSHKRNLIIIDVSGSIPRAVSSTILTLAKHLAESFYCDILITATESHLYLYENLHELNVKEAYNYGMCNNQVYFKALVSQDIKEYQTAIVFGDNDHPGQNWDTYTNISDEEGKKICKWKVDKVISFHTNSNRQLAGYARWFNPTTIENISDWITYLDN